MRQLVYDLPTRVFHWLFFSFFLAAIFITKILGDDSPAFPYHMLIGLTLSFLVILRIIWGFVGTKHARFSGFNLNPLNLVKYFVGLVTGDKTRFAGHNPASSWAAILMIGFALGLGITGYLMASGSENEILEEIHEILSTAFIVVAILHVLGIALHTIRHREMIGLSMVDGKKANIDSKEVVPSSKSALGFLLLALVLGFGLYVFKNYDAPSGGLNLFGNTLQLGESEGEEESQGEENNESHED